MPDLPDSETMLCGACGAVWVVTALAIGETRSEDCLQCGGPLAATGTDADAAEEPE